jgi:hypothetical protein
MQNCRAIQQSDEMYCAPCNLRWDVNDSDAPRCRPEITSDEPDLTTRATLEAVAAGYHDLIALQAKQRKTMALMLKLCIMRIENPDSRKRREGIAGLKELMAMLEKQS